MTIIDELMQYKEEENAAFQAKLTPGIPVESFLGIRVPNLRIVEKQFRNTMQGKEFLKNLPHQYYDENMLHSIFISNMKNYDEVLECLSDFLPYIDNWAVCDTLRPKAFKKHPEGLMDKILEWIASDKTYTCRFGIDMMMTYYLDEYFRPENNEIVAAVRSEEYYINMMVAWYFATALAKQWDSTIPYIEGKKLDVWTHNKTIQKACESYRITAEQKEYLRTFKIKK